MAAASWLALTLAAVVGAAAAGPAQGPSVEVFHIGFHHPGDDALKQSVAVFRLPFNGQVVVQRAMNASIFDDDFYPEQQESQYGLVRLRCGNVTVESFPSDVPEDDLVDYVPDFLVPGPHANAFPLAEIASLLSAPNRDAPSSRSQFEGILFLGDRAAGRGSGVDIPDLASCRMDFLGREEQRWEPVGQFQDATGAPVEDRGVAFAPARLHTWPLRDGSSPDAEGTERVGQLAGMLLRRAFGNSSAGTNPDAVPQPPVKAPSRCMPLPQGLERDEPLTLLETTKEIPGLSGMVKGILKGMVVPMMGAMAGTIGGLLTGGAYADSSSQASDKGFDSEITSLLTHRLTQDLSGAIVPPLSAAIPPAVEEAVAARMSQFLSQEITNMVTDRVTATVNKAVDASVPALVVDEEPEEVARRTSHSLSHVLTRSLTHSIVPALAHALTHNPLEDYYCFYCYHKKAYCQYCHYSPQQLYYSMYYSGFYSAYYADYFTDYFTATISTKPAHRQEPKFTSFYSRQGASEQ